MRQRNKTRFYVVRDKLGVLWLYLGKPIKGKYSFYDNPDKKSFCLTFNINRFGLNPEDYAYLKWEDGPVEVFLNLED